MEQTDGAEDKENQSNRSNTSSHISPVLPLAPSKKTKKSKKSKKDLFVDKKGKQFITHPLKSFYSLMPNAPKLSKQDLRPQTEEQSNSRKSHGVTFDVNLSSLPAVL